MSAQQSTDRRYVGRDFDTAGPGTVIVKPEDRELNDGNDNDDLPSHSPDGFQCGYTGSGPAQLAAALLYDVTGDLELTHAYYQTFKQEVVAVLDDDWVLYESEIEEWVENKGEMDAE